MSSEDVSESALLVELREARTRIAQLEAAVSRPSLSEEYFRVIVDNSLAVLFIIDAAGIFQLSEGAALSAMGLEPGQVVGQDAFEMYADFPDIVRHIRAALAGETHSVELELGALFFDIFYSPYRDSEGLVLGVLGMAIDITERKKAQTERDKLQGQLLHSQKMEAVGRLAGGIAHDFNNVLCAITGNAELAMEDLPGDDPVHDTIREIAEAASRATGLTQQLLAFSRRQLMEPKTVSLSRIIGGLHAMLTRLIGEDVVLRTVPDPEVGLIWADPGQLEQIVLNLAVNARDAMPNGGELLIETANVRLDERYCREHTDAKVGDYVVLSVSDTGSGMSPEVLSKIFEPFFTTKDVGKGTGLGLATVFGIVEQSGGRIEVCSEFGHGTSFKVYFPRSNDNVTLGSERPTATATATQTGTILVVEDEDVVRRLAARILQRHGYTVIVAASGHDALQLAAAHEGAIDLLLTDVVMPHMNGRVLAEQLVSARPELRVLFTSGYTQDVIAHHGVLDEGLSFVAKPYTPAGLAAKVKEALG